MEKYDTAVNAPSAGRPHMVRHSVMRRQWGKTSRDQWHIWKGYKLQTMQITTAAAAEEKLLLKMSCNISVTVMPEDTW